MAAARASIDQPPAAGGASRRTVMAAAGAGALTAFLAACGKDEIPERQPPPPSQKVLGSAADSRFGRGDVGILNYALTLEHVEADFYEQVLGARRLRGRARELAREIGRNEREHVDALRAAVRRAGGRPVERPRTNFDRVLEAPEEEVLAAAAALENVGAAAYLGQAEFVEEREVLEELLSIHTVEGQHAAAINEVAGFPFVKSKFEGSMPGGAFPEGLRMQEVLREIQQFLD